MLALWLHEMGARVVALPFRIVIGLVFIYQGVLNVNRPDETMGMLLNFSDFGIDSEFVPAMLGIVLVIAGILAIVGMFVRIIGLGLFVVVLLNLFAGLTADQMFVNFSQTAMVLQNRLLLAVCAMVLFFLGPGMLSMDDLIFRGMSRALGRGKDNGEAKAKGGRH